MSAVTWIAVGALGGAAAVARMLATLGIGGPRPYRGTLAVNLLGTFVLGVLSGAHVGGDALLLAGTAFLGALTTFSTWMHEVVGFWQTSRRAPAVALLAGGVAAGLAAATLGRLAGGA